MSESGTFLLITHHFDKDMADEQDRRNVTGPGAGSNAYEREQMTDLDDRTRDRPRGMALHTRILIGLVVGVVAGVLTYTLFGVPDAAGGRLPHPRIEWLIANLTEPIGQLFLRLLLMIVVPLVFSSLVVGVAGIGDIRKLGRVGLKAFADTFVISGISVVIGLTMANPFSPEGALTNATQRGLDSATARTASKRVRRTRPKRAG